MRDYEETASFLDRWGRFQRRVFFLLCLSSIPSGYNILSVIFLLASPAHHCLIPEHRNLSQDWIQAIIPVQEVDGRLERSSCRRYQLDLVQNLSALGVRPSQDLVQNLSALGSRPSQGLVQNLGSNTDILLSGLQLESCNDGWTYNTEHYQSTVATEFNLVCGDQWKQPLTSSIYFLGGLSGCFVSGPISDRFGRKPVLFGTMAILSIFSAALAFAPSWPVFTVLFFLLGLGQIANYVVVFVLGTEILIGPVRVLYSNLCLPVCTVFGIMLLPGTAYLVRNWRHLALVLALPGLACIPLWWLVPESPRWLLCRGRLEEAELLLRAAALENGMEAPPIIFLQDAEAAASQRTANSHSFLDLVRTSSMRRNTLILWLIWFSLYVTYFGLSFNMSGLHGNPFLNYFLLAVIEIPAYFASWLVVRSLPRRPSFAACILLGATALLLIQITPRSLPGLSLSLVLLGKFGVLSGIAVVFVYTGELHPTIIRNTAVSSCATFSRVGSSLSPYLVQLAVFYQYLPWIVLGSLSVLSVVVCVFLPESYRRPLPDTIQQMALTQRSVHSSVPDTVTGGRWRYSKGAFAKDHGKSAKDQIAKPEVIHATPL